MSEWISVKERLPEEKQRVIVRCERIGTSVGWILWGEWMTDIGPRAGKSPTGCPSLNRRRRDSP